MNVQQLIEATKLNLDQLVTKVCDEAAVSQLCTRPVTNDQQRLLDDVQKLATFISDLRRQMHRFSDSWDDYISSYLNR